MLLLLLQKQKSCIQQNGNPPTPDKTVTITEAKVTSVPRQHAFTDQETPSAEGHTLHTAGPSRTITPEPGDPQQCSLQYHSQSI